MATAKQLIEEAKSIEASANESLESWVVLGQTEKYSQHMEKAANLRRAAALKAYERGALMRLKGLQ